MIFNAPSFFAGIATVVALVTLGFGGGVLMSGVISDKAPHEPSKVEKRAAENAKPPAAETVKPVAVEARPAVTVAPPAAETAPQAAPAPAAAPPPAPPVQQATTEPQPQPTTPPTVPQVRRVDLPPPVAAPAPVQEAKPLPQPTAPSHMMVRQVPLGPEKPAALVNPPPDISAAQREAREKAREARKKEHEAKQLEKKRKREERKLAEQRRRESIKEAEELRAANARPRQQDDDDEVEVREERPSFFGRPREQGFGRPFFRLFGGEDD